VVAAAAVQDDDDWELGVRGVAVGIDDGPADRRTACCGLEAAADHWTGGEVGDYSVFTGQAESGVYAGAAWDDAGLQSADRGDAEARGGEQDAASGQSWGHAR
jgi:hypothetical protein